MLDKNKMGGKKMNSKKILTFVLAMLMIITSLPLQLFAEKENYRFNAYGIADPRLREILQRRYDRNRDGVFDNNELKSVKKLDLSSAGFVMD